MNKIQGQKGNPVFYISYKVGKEKGKINVIEKAVCSDRNSNQNQRP